MRYKSFMLRVWQRHDVDGVEWAGSLESIQAPGEWRFRTVDQLLAQLRRLAEADAVRETTDRGTGPADEPLRGGRAMSRSGPSTVEEGRFSHDDIHSESSKHVSRRPSVEGKEIRP